MTQHLDKRSLRFTDLAIYQSIYQWSKPPLWLPILAWIVVYCYAPLPLSYGAKS